VKKKALFNWSGGKDSSIALYRILKQKEYSVDTLYTSVNSSNDRISMHGVQLELLKRQAESIGIPLEILRLPEQPSMKEYNQLITEELMNFKKEGYSHSIYGDIFLEDLRLYREKLIHELGITIVFPIWKENTRSLVKKFVDDGFKAVTVCIKADKLSKEFAGRQIDHEFINDLPKNVDPCGENGEFHSFVYDGPLFSKPIDIRIGDLTYQEYKAPNEDDDQRDLSAEKDPKKMGFWFCDIAQA